MDFRRLKYFLVVAEEGHITRAAERLGMQQPPLSHQIKLLEEDLETQLFLRTPKGVELTDAGRTLYDDAKRIFSDLDRARNKVMRTARGEQGRIVFGFTHATAFHPVMLRSLTQFHDRFPKVELSVLEATTGELVDEIQAAALDVAMVRSDVADRGAFQLHELQKEPMVAALPSSHDLARSSGPLELAQLAGQPLVLSRRASSPGLYDTIIAGFRSLNITPWVAQDASNVIASVSLASAGFGIAIVPQSMTAMQLKTIVYRRIDTPAQLYAPLRLLHPKRGQSEAARQLVQLIRRNFADKVLA